MNYRQSIENRPFLRSVTPWLLVAGLGGIGLSLGRDDATQLDRGALEPKKVVVAQDGDVLSGHITVDSYRIPEGVVVVVDDDLTIESTYEIVVHGEFAALQRPLTSPKKEGISIRLVSEAIFVAQSGKVRAGKGRDACAPPFTLEDAQLEGGTGGVVELEAVASVIEGKVIAGPGGQSAPHGRGGTGGGVVVRGHALSSDTHEGCGIYGGSGGGHLAPSFTHAYPAGPGGRGGDVKMFPPKKNTIRADGVVLANALFDRYIPGFRKPIVSANADAAVNSAPVCEAGSTGGGGCPTFGGTGDQGNTGANGTEQSPQGQTGGIGCGGGDAQGGGGCEGDVGHDCCPCAAPKVGGKGGTGGIGGKGTGGRGGKGGRGGNGYYNIAEMKFTGPKGNGGPGGTGGLGVGGRSGDGGDGGKQAGPKGDPGPAGPHTVGPPGPGGECGLQGIAPCNTGDEGDEGGGGDGAVGGEGALGSNCDT